ncbi:MAG: DUF350 domain-containing protein [Bacteroidota bacterium]
MKNAVPRLVLLALGLVLAVPAWAQDAPQGRAADLDPLVFMSTVAYGLLGIVLCVLGYFAFDKIAGLNLKHELVEDQNVALGIMLAGVFIGIAIVVAAVMLS